MNDYICTIFYVTICHMTVTCRFYKISNNKLLYNGAINHFKKQVGSYKFLINEKTLTINNLEINEDYRRRGFGSYALKRIEDYSKKIYDVKKVKLTAWDISGSSSNFFKYNNYNDTSGNLSICDPECLYDLIKFEKSLD